MEVATLKLAGERNDVSHPGVQMPTKWGEKHKCLVVFDDGRGVKIVHDEASNEKGASAARADHPVPRDSNVYYYEVTIIDKGKKGHISIGFCTAEVDLSRLPGWDEGSWGYHGDDGHSFAGERAGTPFGPRFTTGDTIGCGIDFKIGKAFYTKNGEFLGYAFENLGRDIEVFPSVGLRTSGESVFANFGQDAFKYDLSSYDWETQKNYTS